MQQPTTLEKPDFARKWFWDLDYDKIDWQASYKTVIARIVERGKEEQWQELVRFYGLQKVIDTLKNEIVFLPDYAIEESCTYFPIKKEEMLCYTKKQSRPAHWL